MPTPYFDATNEFDTNLLPAALRTDSELLVLAQLVEADVIAHFTRHVPSTAYTAREGVSDEPRFGDSGWVTDVVGEDVSNQAAPAGAVVPQIRVYLRGYKADAADPAVDPNLKLALKRAIAEVIRWRLAQWKSEQQALSSSADGGGKSRSYRDSADDPFPKGWDRWVRPFRSDEPLAVL